jgi:hypothetical protein
MSECTVAGEATRETERGERNVDRGLIEAMADQAREARDGDGAEGIARGQRVTVHLDPDLPHGVDGLVTSEAIYVRPRGSPAYVFVLILHELAHWMLSKAGLPDAHGDVWTLALALAAPLSLLRRLRAAGPLDAVRLAGETGLPWWAAALRLDMTAVMV